MNELDRTAVRFTVPKWALPMIADRLPPLFSETPKQQQTLIAADFRSKVEEEIRGALLGANAVSPEYATDEAFVLISAPIPNSLRDALAVIPRRGLPSKPEEQINRLPAERTLRFKSDLPAGAVIFASPIPGVFYKQWYSILLLDRLIRRVVPLSLKTALPLSVRPYYYRLELPVPAGQFPEPVEENLLQELQRLQFTRAPGRDFSAAQQETVAYLDSKEVREWFASHDLSARRDEGVQWVQSMNPDDMRVAARDLLIMNRVIATWAPAPKQTGVAVEALSDGVAELRPSPGAARLPSPSGRGRPEGPGESSIVPFPAHKDSPSSTSLPERLASGVSLVASNTNAVFISGGSMTRFDHELAVDDLKQFQKYRADRVLVLAPASSMDFARQLWSSFKGSNNGETGVPKGNISSGDLPALFVLKTLLDLRIIESGWWHEAQVRIDAGEGSTLEISADDEKRTQILDWIKAIASGPPADTYFTWVREVALHRFDIARPDLQALTWERDPQGIIQDLETITPKHVQDIARIYF